MPGIRRSILSLLILAAPASGQTLTTYVIDTVVGGAVYDNLPATATPLSSPTGLWRDRSGALWIADTGNQVIRRLDPSTGILKVMVGGGTITDDAVPVPGTSALLNSPSHITGDTAGNIYFTDSGAHRVRTLTADGQVSTIVGTGVAGFSGDGGPARLARLNGPTGLAVDSAGNLYISDTGNCRIRRVDTSGVIATFAGNGQCPFPGNETVGDGGPALSAAFRPPINGLAFDSNGNLYIATHQAIRRVDKTTGIVSTVLRDGGPCPSPGRSCAGGVFNSLVFDSNDNLFYSAMNRCEKLTLATGEVTGLAGTGGGASGGAGVALTGNGNLLYATFGGFVYETSTTVPQPGPPQNPVAGSLEVFDGPARLAVLARPTSLGLDSLGRLYIGDGGHGRIRRFDPATGLVSTIAGGGNTDLFFDVDGISASAARIGRFTGSNLIVRGQGDVYFEQFSTLWRFDNQAGKIFRVSGTRAGSSGDGGPALQAGYGEIRGMVADSAGNLFVMDPQAYRVRRIDSATGIVTTVAGNGIGGFSGDGGPATAASLEYSTGLAFDRQGQLLIGSQTLRRVNLTTGIISSVQGRTAPGEPLNPVRLGGELAVDSEGNIFVFSGARIWQIRATDGVVLSIVGSGDLFTGSAGFSGDGGFAELAQLSPSGPQASSGIVADAPGNFYFADQTNGRIRKVTRIVVKPVMAISPATLFFTAVQGSTLLSAQTVSIAPANTLSFNWTLSIATSAGGNWLLASRSSGVAPATVTLTVDSSRLGPGTYRGTVTVSTSESSNSPQTVEVVLTVQGLGGPVLGISQQFLGFQAVQGAANPAPQSITISNAGTGTLI